MIQLVQERGFVRVACFCDQCGEEITDGDTSMYTWDNAIEGKAAPAGTRYTPKYFHKGECARPFGRKPFMDMTVFPIYLGENLELDWKEARRKAELMASL